MRFHIICITSIVPSIVVAAQARQQADAPVQPVPFSHKKHMSLGLRCNDCHPNADPGEAMTFPSVAKCMLCHVTIAKDKPDIRKLAEYAASKQEVPWFRVYQVPDWVFWSHRTHLDAKIVCESCHGDVKSVEVTAKSTDVTTMGGCVACHIKRKAPTGCQTCHENRSS